MPTDRNPILEYELTNFPTPFLHLSLEGEELIMKNLKNGKREFRTMRIDFTFSQGYNSRPNLNSFIILSSSINSETRII